MFKYRYGMDKLNLFLLLVSIPFALYRYTYTISLLLISYSLYRSLSKDFTKRQRELYKFENILWNIKKKSLRQINAILNRFKYKVVICPNCLQRLRVPRFKGKLIITCKSCKYQFKFKS